MHFVFKKSMIFIKSKIKKMVHHQNVFFKKMIFFVALATRFQHLNTQFSVHLRALVTAQL